MYGSRGESRLLKGRGGGGGGPPEKKNHGNHKRGKVENIFFKTEQFPKHSSSKSKFSTTHTTSHFKGTKNKIYITV